MFTITQASLFTFSLSVKSYVITKFLNFTGVLYKRVRLLYIKLACDDIDEHWNKSICVVELLLKTNLVFSSNKRCFALFITVFLCKCKAFLHDAVVPLVPFLCFPVFFYYLRCSFLHLLCKISKCFAQWWICPHSSLICFSSSG